METVVIAERRYYLLPDGTGTVEIFDHFGHVVGWSRLTGDGQAVVVGPRGCNAMERQLLVEAAHRTGGLTSVA